MSSSPFFYREDQKHMAYHDPKSDEKEYICGRDDSSGMHKCHSLPFFEDPITNKECTASIFDPAVRNGSACVNWYLHYTECRPGDKNPFHGAISFDNIGLAWVAIFLVS